MMERRVGFALAVVCTLVGCEDKTPQEAVPTASALPSAAPAVAPRSKSPLALLASAKDDLLIAGENGAGIVLAGKRGLVLRDGKLAENPTLHQGLENPTWSERTLLARSEELAVLAGKRDPSKLWQGDVMMYMEDKDIGADRTVFRSFRKGSWVRVGAVKEGETFRGTGRYKGRIVAPAEMPGGTDYRFVLVAGKPGMALPAPSAAERKKPEPEPEPEEAAEPAEDDAGAASDSGTDATAAAPPPAKDDKPEEATPAPPPDPDLPHPKSDECATRLVPRAFDGLEDGEAYLIGRVCPGDGEWWVEHWPAGKRKAVFEKLPAGPAGDDALIAATASGEAYAAERGTRLLLRRTANAWSKLAPPGPGSVSALAASPGGRIWIIVGGRVFSRKGDGAWSELVLPEGKTATGVLPADGELTFVAAGHELFGPKSAGPGQVVSIGAGATILCSEPYVLVERKIKRSKRYPDVVEKVKKTGVSGIELVFGHRGMTGEDSIQAKAPDMKTAQALAKALGGADIVCGPPRTEAKVPEK